MTKFLTSPEGYLALAAVTAAVVVVVLALRAISRRRTNRPILSLREAQFNDILARLTDPAESPFEIRDDRQYFDGPRVIELRWRKAPIISKVITLELPVTGSPTLSHEENPQIKVEAEYLLGPETYNTLVAADRK